MDGWTDSLPQSLHLPGKVACWQLKADIGNFSCYSTTTSFSSLVFSPLFNFTLWTEDSFGQTDKQGHLLWDVETGFPGSSLKPTCWSGDENRDLSGAKLECNFSFPTYHEKRSSLNTFKIDWYIYFHCCMSLRRWPISQTACRRDSGKKSSQATRKPAEPGFGLRETRGQQEEHHHNHLYKFMQTVNNSSMSPAMISHRENRLCAASQPASQQVGGPCPELAQTAPGTARWLAPALHEHGGQSSPTPSRMRQLRTLWAGHVLRGWQLSEHPCSPPGLARDEMCTEGRTPIQ